MAIPYEPEPRIDPERCDNCNEWVESTIPHPHRTITVERSGGVGVERRQNLCDICYENEFGPMPEPPPDTEPPF